MVHSNEDLLPFYALGTLTKEERELVEAYLAENPDAKKRLEEISAILAQIPFGVTPLQPREQVKHALIARLEVNENIDQEIENRQANRQQDRSRWISLNKGSLIPVGVSLAATLVVLIWVVLLNVEVTRLRTTVSELRGELIAQQETITQMNTSLIALDTSKGRVFSLHGTEYQPEAQGQLIIASDDLSALLIVSGLAPPPEGQVYQVWLIQGDTPSSAGILEVASKGYALLLIRSDHPLGLFNALGISVEPLGGSQTPTGIIVVLSNLF